MKKLFASLLTVATTLCALSTWATDKHYYATLITKVSATGHGKVYASASTTSSPAYTADGSSVQVDSTNSQGGSVNAYGYAQGDAGYRFVGWSKAQSGATSYDSTGNPQKFSLTASGTEGGNIDSTYYAYFEKIGYQPFSILFKPGEGGTYTVDGGEPVDKTGLTEATTVTLHSDAPNFLNWIIKKADGSVEEQKSSTYIVSFIGKEDAESENSVEAEFLTEDDIATVTTCAELISAMGDDTKLKVQIPSDATIEIPQGTTVTVSKDLEIKGNVLLSGTLVNGKSCSIVGTGTIKTFVKLVTQDCADASGTPFKTTCPLDTYNKKYYKTSVSDLSGKITNNGTISCTALNAARVVRNGAVIAEGTWPNGTTPAVLCCSINSSVAVNHITGFLDPCYNTDVTKGMASVKGKGTTQMLVLLGSASPKNEDYSNAGLLANIPKDSKYWKLQYNGTMDLAGSTLTVAPSYIDNYSHLLLNGGISVSTLVYSGTITCINCSSVSFSKLKEDYASVINIYDCKLGTTKVPKAYNGNSANKNSVNFYSSSGSTYSSSTGNGGNFYNQNPTSVYHIYGGVWSANPGGNYIAPALNDAGYSFYPTSEDATTYSLQPKKDNYVVNLGGDLNYDSLDVAVKELATIFATKDSVKMTMLRKASLTSALTVPAGKKLEIELKGYCITAQNGFVINNGTFEIGDCNGKFDSTGGRVITSSGKFLQNNGTAEITYGYYTGDVVLNGGELTTHHGRFTGAFSAPSGVDKTAVANLRGGYFEKDVSEFLREGYYRTSNYVGPFPKANVTKTWNSSYGGYWKYTVTTLPQADLDLYNNSSAVKESYSLENWKRRGEVLSMVQPWLGYMVDIGVGFDRAIKTGSATARVERPISISENLDRDVGAGELYRVFTPIFVEQGTTEKRYSNFLETGSGLEKFQVTEAGVSSQTEANYGTVANLRVELCTGSKSSPVSYRALASEYAVLGAGRTNEAMVQPASGKATFYSKVASAIAACPKGGTVKLCNDVTSTDEITVSKAVTIDTNGMGFKGKIVPAAFFSVVMEEKTLDVEKGLGKVRRIYTVTQKPGLGVHIK